MHGTCHSPKWHFSSATMFPSLYILALSPSRSDSQVPTPPWRHHTNWHPGKICWHSSMVPNAVSRCVWITLPIGCKFTGLKVETVCKNLFSLVRSCWHFIVLYHLALNICLEKSHMAKMKKQKNGNIFNMFSSDTFRALCLTFRSSSCFDFCEQGEMGQTLWFWMWISVWYSFIYSKTVFLLMLMLRTVRAQFAIDTLIL